MRYIDNQKNINIPVDQNVIDIIRIYADIAISGRNIFDGLSIHSCKYLLEQKQRREVPEKEIEWTLGTLIKAGLLSHYHPKGNEWDNENTLFIHPKFFFSMGKTYLQKEPYKMDEPTLFEIIDINLTRFANDRTYPYHKVATEFAAFNIWGWSEDFSQITQEEATETNHEQEINNEETEVIIKEKFRELVCDLDAGVQFQN